MDAMNISKILAVALAVLVVGAGAAAAIPGQAADQAQDDANDDASDAGPPDDVGATADDANESDDENASKERRGPPADVPAQAPDHVSQIHETINTWMDGGKEGSLDDMISGIVGGGDEADETANGDESATETADAGTETADDRTETTEG